MAQQCELDTMAYNFRKDRRALLHMLYKMPLFLGVLATCASDFLRKQMLYRFGYLDMSLVGSQQEVP